RLHALWFNTLLDLGFQQSSFLISAIRNRYQAFLDGCAVNNMRAIYEPAQTILFSINLAC
ncbi:MAG: hypothetical protein KAU48_00720, partial [Candidatus Thorarchaeota archaeon]|nr:hypothetical protein [Candidatus Thorarchaeota archaeon]